uniref:endo-1,4-beta-xylanase n=1 Tax=uncultured symbiotic protist of Hodotermopsis sjoestedti TaxID=403659 RepID=A4UWT6_9EUKA|nr:putative glycosyl hydrolase family10 [uncultured symbiotic protist of Hodotermopsis sjoestedti]
MFVFFALHARSALATGKSKFLGNIIPYSVPSNWDQYWNQATAENGCKWGSVENGRGIYNWGQCDVTANHCKAAGIPFKYHNFVWGSQEPGYVQNLSQPDQKIAIENYIKAAAAHYGYIEFIDVVNEPLHAVSSVAEALGGAGSTGWDWVVTSFRLVRESFPSSKLLINDYGIINDGGAITKYIKIIDILKNENLIDGIGIQCHYFNVNDFPADWMKYNLDTLAATGLPIYPSELDINAGSEENQSIIYQRVFPVLWEHYAVKGITLWGYITGSTWASNTGIVEVDRHERQAMTWLKSYLRSH